MNLKATGISTSIVIVILAILTIWSELSKPLKDFLASLTGHHWTTKSVFSIILFILLYFVFVKTKDNSDIIKTTKIVIWTTIVITLTVFLFYIYEFFHG
jgi:ABC-type uncharacterized transport system permease subunit